MRDPKDGPHEHRIDGDREQGSKRIGILGGGQLGSLLLESLYRLGANVSIYDQDVSAPGLRRTPHAFKGSWTDESMLSKFFGECDAVTYEFENVESSMLGSFEKTTPILPRVSVLKTTQDRILEKQFIATNDLPYGDFAVIEDFAELIPCAEKFGYPFILKTARGGYDGKGQFLITSKENLADFDGQKMKPFRMVLERVIDIGMEVSCIVARSRTGEEVCFPVMENVHREHILDTTVVPARISAPVEVAIREIAMHAAHRLDVHGLLTTEFFLSAKPGNNNHGFRVGSWNIFINEFAPRPHNSGHVTMKACTISQYEALARVLLDIPLPEPQIVAPGYFCMANLLGDVWLAQERNQLDLSCMAKHPRVIDVVLYGKEEPRSKRKMGHLVTYASSAQEAVSAAISFRNDLGQNILKKA